MSEQVQAVDRRAKIRAALEEIARDAVGLVGWCLVVVGVRAQWGAGYGYIAAGLPLMAGYVWRELVMGRQRARAGDR